MSRILLFHWGLEGGDFEVHRITDNGKEHFVQRYNYMDFDENDDEIWRQGETEYPSFEYFWQEALRDEDWFRCYPLFIHDDCKPIIRKSLDKIVVAGLTEIELSAIERWKRML